MDLEKVALQAKGSNVQNGQKADSAPSAGSGLGMPFADLIKLPMLSVTDLLPRLDNQPITSSDAPTEQRDPEPEQNKNREAPVERSESSEHAPRDSNNRADNNTDERRENNNQQSDNRSDSGDQRDQHSATRDDKAQNKSNEDVTKADGNSDPVSKTDGNDDPGSKVDGNSDPDSKTDGSNVPVSKAADNSDLGSGADGNGVPVSKANDNSDPGEGENHSGKDKAETLPQHSEGVQTTEAIVAGGDIDPVINAALQDIIQANRPATPEQMAKEVVEAIKKTMVSQNTGPGTDARGQQQNAMNPNAEAELQQAVQQALRQVVRQSTTTPGSTADAAAKSADQTIVQQQAQTLSNSLKPDKPVNVNVTVENRAAVAVSQPGQNLSANAASAQTAEGAAQTIASNPQRSDRPAILQAQPNIGQQQTGVNVHVQAQAQTQAQAQAAQNPAAAAGERSAARTIGQLSGGGQHGVSSGAESLNNASGSTTASTTQTQQTAQTAKAQAAQAPRAPQQPQPIVQQISVNITKAIAEGMDRISINLRPDNLGRVEVKLTVAQDGRVSAQVIVDRPETLDTLRNDSRSLEKALQEAGLQANAGDLSFNLRNQQDNPDGSDSENRVAEDDEEQIDGDLEAELAARILDGSIGDIITDKRVDIRA